MNTPNNNFFPWDDIQEDNVFPVGCYKMAITKLEDGSSNKTGNRMFSAQYTCSAPAEFVGMSHFEYYVVGTDENPGGINAGTMGARGLKKLLKAANVPQNNSIEQLCISAIGAEFMLTLNVYVEPAGSAYAGDKKNRIVSYDPVGSKDAAVAPTVGAGKAITPPNMPPVVAPAAVTAPVMPVQPAPVQPVAPVMPAPVAAPVVPAAPVAAAPPVSAPPIVPPAAVNPSDPMITCTICSQQVPASQLGAHVAAHAQAG